MPRRAHVLLMMCRLIAKGPITSGRSCKPTFPDGWPPRIPGCSTSNAAERQCELPQSPLLRLSSCKADMCTELCRHRRMKSSASQLRAAGDCDSRAHCAGGSASNPAGAGRAQAGALEPPCRAGKAATAPWRADYRPCLGPCAVPVDGQGIVQGTGGGRGGGAVRGLGPPYGARVGALLAQKRVRRLGARRPVPKQKNLRRLCGQGPASGREVVGFYSLVYGRAEVRRSFITKTVWKESQVTPQLPQGRHR